MTRPFLLLLAVLLLSGCGDLPQPFAGNPGAVALRLAAPPPPRLDVPAPQGALLADADTAIWTRALVAGLLDKQVPAVAQPRRRGDWSLSVSATRDGDLVTPHFLILGPDNRARARRDGSPVPAAQWSGTDPQLVAANAAAAADTISAMLGELQARAAQSDPNSLLNRPTRVWFAGVSGAPGGGDSELADQMRALLPDEHDTLQTDQAHADYIVSGHVAVSSPANGVQHVEIVWTVTRTVVGSDGRPAHEAGKATQLHDVPAHALDAAWGDIAIAAAGEAASGVHEVISNNEGRSRQGAGPGAKGDAKGDAKRDAGYGSTGTRSPDGPLVNQPLAAPPGDSLPLPKA